MKSILKKVAWLVLAVMIMALAVAGCSNPSSGKLDLFLVTFRREKFRDSIALVV